MHCSMISFNQINLEEDRLSDQVTNDRERSEIGSQIDDDDGQIDFDEIISDQGNIIEKNPNYERMKYRASDEVHYRRLLREKDNLLGYILGEDEQSEENKIQSDTMMSQDDTIQLVKTQDQIDHNFRHATATTADCLLTKASAATVTVVVEDQNFRHAAIFSSTTSN